MSDVVSIVGLKGKPRPSIAGRNFVKNSGIAMAGSQSPAGVAFTTIAKADLEAELVRRSAPSIVFPRRQSSQLLHECLFLTGVNFIGSWRSLLRGTVTLLTQGQLDDYLTDRIGGERSVRGTRSIFFRLGYVDADGVPLRATTHQFRHWLNTLAQEGGLSQVEISRWMGRRTIDDNAAYDHQTGFQLAKRVRERITDGAALGSSTTTLRRIKDPVRRAEFGQSLVASAHVTDIGICVQDLSALPCERHRECVTCNDHFIQKGDAQQRHNAQLIFDDAQLMLRLAQAEQGAGSYGADNWLAYQQLVLRRASDVLRIHADDSITDGTLVQVPNYVEPTE